MIQINDKIYTEGLTHAGKFHADDVCCAALLRMLDPKFEIRRSNTIPGKRDNILIFDIGNTEFDHHAIPREQRPNGYYYAAFGKLWRAIGDQFKLDKHFIEGFDKDIVQYVDMADNTGRKNPFSVLISDLNPTWNSEQDFDSAFWRAVDICQRLFEAYFAKVKSVMDAEHIAVKLCNESSDGIVVADYFLPSSAFPKGFYFFICPSHRGGWQAISIKQPDSEEQILFSTEGETPKGMLFCHASGFMASFQTKEHAIEYCRTLVKERVIDE